MRIITEDDLKTNACIVCLTCDGEEMCTVEYIEDENKVLVLPLEIDEFREMSVEDALKYVNDNEELKQRGSWWGYGFDSEEPYPLE